MSNTSLVTFSDIFQDEEEQEHDFYLRGASRKSLLEFSVAILNTSQYTIQLENSTELILNELFAESNKEFLSNLLSKFKEVQDIKTADGWKVSSDIILVSSYAALKLVNYIMSKENLLAEDEISIPDIEINVFKLLLAINTFLNTTGLEAQEALKGSDDENIKSTIMMNMPEYDIINCDFIKIHFLFVCQLAKGILLFDFLSVNRPHLLSLFLKKYDCESVFEYLSLYRVIVLSILDIQYKSLIQKKPTSFVLALKDEHTKLINFYNRLTTNTDIIPEDIDFRPLRSSPLLKINDRSFAVVNSLFVLHKLYNSMYFELKELNDDKKVDFRGFITYNFTEKYLLYKIMKDIYGHRGYVQVTGEEIDSKYKIQGGPDYYIRNGNIIFLIENKDILIEAGAKTSLDFNKIEAEIHKKLVTKEGIPQIINNVINIISSQLSYDLKKDAKKSIIYPILITHNSELDTPGMNFYLRDIFRDKLREKQELGYRIENVKDLTIININSLLYFQNAFKTKKLRLDELIDSYHDYMSKKYNYKSYTELRDKVENSYASFTDALLKHSAQERGVDERFEGRRWLRFINERESSSLKEQGNFPSDVYQ